MARATQLLALQPIPLSRQTLPERLLMLHIPCLQLATLCQPVKLRELWLCPLRLPILANGLWPVGPDRPILKLPPTQCTT